MELLMLQQLLIPVAALQASRLLHVSVDNHDTQRPAGSRSFCVHVCREGALCNLHMSCLCRWLLLAIYTLVCIAVLCIFST